MVRSRISWEAPRPGRFTIDDWEIDLAKTALVVVDMQRGYTEPEMGVGPGLERDFPEIHRYYYSAIGERVLPGIKKLLDFARSRGLECIYTRTGLQLPGGRDVAPWSWRAVQAGSSAGNLFAKDSPHYQIVPDIAPLPHELVLDKNTATPFASTALDQLLRNMGVENLLIAGLLTNVAVESTARSAGDRGYNPIVVSDACAAYSEAEHEDTLATASWWTAKDVEEVIRIFSALEPTQQP